MKWVESPSSSDGRGRTTLPTLGICLAILAVIGSLVRPAEGANVVRVEWGIGGSPILRTFNPVSVLLDNPEEQPEEVFLRLRDDQGAATEESVYLAPFERRWVPIYVYVDETNSDWELEWRDARGIHLQKVANKEFSTETRLQLLEPDSLASRRLGWTSLTDDRFPTSVTMMESVESILLDYVPRWDAARRQVLLDWLMLGGNLVLVTNSQGDWPEFPGELSVLNSPEDKYSFGLGKVWRCTRSDVAATISQVEMRSSEERTTFPHGNDLEMTAGRAFRRLTRPDHNWPLIHTLLALYAFAVCPGIFLIARRRVHFMITIGLYALLVLVSSFAINRVGQRGYGEQTQTHSISWARSLGGDAYCVTRWCSFFSTEGTITDVRYAGSGHLFSSGTVADTTNSLIDNGTEGKVRLDIPMFSSRTFIHCARQTGGFHVKATLTGRHTGEGAEWTDADLRIDGLLETPTAHGLAVYRDKLWHLRPDDDNEWHLTEGERLADWVQSRDNSHFVPYEFEQSVPGDTSMRTTYARLLPAIVKHSLGLHEQDIRDTYPSTHELMRAYILIPEPEAWRIVEPVIEKQTRYVVVEIPVDAKDLDDE